MESRGVITHDMNIWYSRNHPTTSSLLPSDCKSARQSAYLVAVSQTSRKCGFSAGATSCSWDRIALNDEIIDAFYGSAFSSLPRSFGACMLKSVYYFDPALFRLSQTETQTMDPQHRLLLLATADLYFAKKPIFSSRDTVRTFTVHVGVSWADFQEIMVMAISSSNVLSTYFSTGTSLSVASGRISYHFDLGGGATTIDTACSACLVALDHSINATTRTDVSYGLVCGVNLILTQSMTQKFNAAGMLSKDLPMQDF
jgi:3-oxoacyl-(acyl-carrier-protein) synthase